MALAKKAKQPVRGAAATKSAKTASKAVKGGKKAAPPKTNPAVKVKAVVKPPVAESTKPVAAKAKKSAAEQPKTVVTIVAAKAALKRESSEKRPATVAPAPTPAKTKSRKISIDVNPTEAASALSQKWNSLYKKAEQIDAKPYNMKAIFEEKTAIVHKVLGWGYILANRNDRLEVLFKDGIKYLISNYKP